MLKIYMLKIPTFLIVFSFIIYILYNVSPDLDVDNMFKAKNMNELSLALDIETAEIDNLKKEHADQLKKIDKMQDEIDSIISDSIRIRSEIVGLEETIGSTDLRGQGITIRMTDNLTDDFLSIDQKLVHDLDVRMIINELNSAGAEAIAINGKRIVSTTEIICIGPVIRINGDVVAAPFIIKAIGDPEVLLEKAIESPASYADYLKTNFGIDITAIKNYDISIPKNTEKFKVNFAKAKAEEE